MRRISRWLILWYLFVYPQSAFAALPHPDRSEVVTHAKLELQIAGVDLTGPCGAFQITKLTAWRLHTTDNAGLLSKPTGNNCDGFAVDIIAYPDGQIYDILIDSGGTNIPTWGDAGVVELSRYRSAIDPGVILPPPPSPPSPPVTIDLSGVHSRLDAMQTEILDIKERVDAVAVSLEAHRVAERKFRDQVIGFFKDSRTIAVIIGVLSGKFIIPG